MLSAWTGEEGVDQNHTNDSHPKELLTRRKKSHAEIPELALCRNCISMSRGQKRLEIRWSDNVTLSQVLFSTWFKVFHSKTSFPLPFLPCTINLPGQIFHILDLPWLNLSLNYEDQRCTNATAAATTGKYAHSSAEGLDSGRGSHRVECLRQPFSDRVKTRIWWNVRSRGFLLGDLGAQLGGPADSNRDFWLNWA